MPTELTLRPLEEADRAEVAEVHVEARLAAYPAMPRSVHPPGEVRSWMGGLVERALVGELEMWVAASPEGVDGYLVVTGDWLEHLYVRPPAWGRGVGSALVELAKGLRPQGFALWVFESNIPARRLYEKHGLVTLEVTDGSGNEERAPDVRMAWPGTDPLAYLRGQVDRVDTELALLLARRAALTAAIQPFKPVPGHAGRDPEREAEIVERMAAIVPGLPRLVLARVVHEVIEATLDTLS